MSAKITLDKLTRDIRANRPVDISDRQLARAAEALLLELRSRLPVSAVLDHTLPERLLDRAKERAYAHGVVSNLARGVR